MRAATRLRSVPNFLLVTLAKSAYLILPSPLGTFPTPRKKAFRTDGIAKNPRRRKSNKLPRPPNTSVRTARPLLNKPLSPASELNDLVFLWSTVFLSFHIFFSTPQSCNAVLIALSQDQIRHRSKRRGVCLSSIILNSPPIPDPSARTHAFASNTVVYYLPARLSPCSYPLKKGPNSHAPVS